SPPRPGQDREAWLKALRTYREMVRAGGAAGMIQLNFDGVRTWTRLSLEASRDLALQPGDRVEARIEARWRQGNGEICAAFDRVDGSSGAWVGWTGVLASADTPRDDAWHTHTLRLEVPATELQNVLFRPIFGLDATHNATPGVVDIRDIALAKVAVPRRRDVPVAFPESAQGAEENQRPRGVYERAFPPLDRSSYDRPDLAWARGMFTCHFTFMYDRAFYDPERGYLVEAFLDDGAREFGGYDAVVLWQGYPRLGIDERNQFDMYRDMPGGMAGLHDMVRRFHARGVKVFIDYNPWDIGTRRPEKPDVDMLAELVAALDADGIFLDTLSAASPSLRAKVDAVRPGVVIAPEIHPPIDQLGVLNLSWAQWLNDPRPPGMLHLKWIEPRHLQHQIRRWHSSHREEIEIAFFNGSGMLVWENIFGSYNPWTEEDRALWRRCAPILRAFRANFTSDAWDPYYPTLQEGLYAHRWPAKTNSWDLPVVFTLRRVGEPVAGDAPAISIPASARQCPMGRRFRCLICGQRSPRGLNAMAPMAP
ncbi:MAG: hypothetical protein HYV26_06230, partial [Candidatus Hydrogenedentes bacterium]|nr:hypothetical protein [Candidatus Hydrogenedentota bacterium]